MGRRILRSLALLAVLTGTTLFGPGQDAKACHQPTMTYCSNCCPQYYQCRVWWYNPCIGWQTDYCLYTPWGAQRRVAQLKCCGYYAYYYCYPYYPCGCH